VSAAREEAKRIDEVVERRLVESLTGMTAEEAREVNVVPPGEKTETAVWRSVEPRIAKVNGQPGTTGYLGADPGGGRALLSQRWLAHRHPGEPPRLLITSFYGPG
jgi:hypothetical protein